MKRNIILSLLYSIQFTLCHIMKGNKPDFHDAMNSELSKPMYDEFLKIIRSQYKPEAIKSNSTEATSGHDPCVSVAG